MKRVVFQNANLVDGENPARAGVTVIVEGERIEGVYPSEAPSPRPDDRVVDLAGRTLMPGLFSCHFHTTFHNLVPGEAPALQILHSPASYTLLAARNLRTALECGVTGIVCSSAPYGIDAALKQGLDEGWITGPRMLGGSHELMVTNDIAAGVSRNYWLGLGNPGLVHTADGADEFRTLVREEIRNGADVVKISASGGHNAGPTEDRVNLMPDELEAAVDAAHSRGKLVRAHAASRASVLACATTGVDLIDHADRMDEECVEAILENDATVVPTLFYMLRVLDFMGGDHIQAMISPGVRPMFEKTLQSMREDSAYLTGFLPRVEEAGVRIVCGDDFGTTFLQHGEYAAELEFYVKQVGMAPLDVVRWATRNGAQAMGRGDELGTVEAGKLADLLVVDGDPLSDIRCLQDRERLHGVMLGGEFAVDKLPHVAAA